MSQTNSAPTQKSELRDQAISAAKSLPDLISKAKQVSPEIADALDNKALIYSKTPWGTLLASAAAWASAKWGLGWDADMCALVGAAGAFVGAAVMRYISSAQITGIISSKPVGQ